ncbi:MAG TPA: SDR family oxidoreductase [Anaerolineaceae bacterium]|nr:SDR family oxidoreductase [Anaerolineaceae bacterium]
MTNHEAAPLAVVTGAGVRLGRAIAESLAGRGYALGVHYHHSQAAAEDLAGQVTRQGGKAFLLSADLTDPAQIEDLFEQVAAVPHPLKVLVNSAAVMPAGRLGETSVEAWDATLDLNLRAPWLCACQAARLMKDGGAIVNLSDAGTVKSWTGYPAYLVSKAGVETLTRLLASDLAPGVRVNAVAPGLILPSDEVSTETWDRLIDRLPLKRSGSTDEITQAVLFLIENAYITGQTIVVDGGYRLK